MKNLAELNQELESNQKTVHAIQREKMQEIYNIVKPLLGEFAAIAEITYNGINFRADSDWHDLASVSLRESYSREADSTKFIGFRFSCSSQSAENAEEFSRITRIGLLAATIERQMDAILAAYNDTNAKHEAQLRELWSRGYEIEKQIKEVKEAQKDDQRTAIRTRFLQTGELTFTSPVNMQFRGMKKFLPVIKVAISSDVKKIKKIVPVEVTTQWNTGESYKSTQKVHMDELLYSALRNADKL